MPRGTKLSGSDDVVDDVYREDEDIDDRMERRLQLDVYLVGDEWQALYSKKKSR